MNHRLWEVGLVERGGAGIFVSAPETRDIRISIQPGSRYARLGLAIPYYGGFATIDDRAVM